MFNLTKQERMVILFLISVAFLGVGIDFLLKKNTSLEIISFISNEKDVGKIGLNQADADSLKSLPGIGEKLAERIIEYRQGDNGFDDIEELKNIKGIGKAKYDSIKDYLEID